MSSRFLIPTIVVAVIFAGYAIFQTRHHEPFHPVKGAPPLPASIAIDNKIMAEKTLKEAASPLPMVTLTPQQKASVKRIEDAANREKDHQRHIVQATEKDITAAMTAEKPSRVTLERLIARSGQAATAYRRAVVNERIGLLQVLTRTQFAMLAPKYFPLGMMNCQMDGVLSDLGVTASADESCGPTCSPGNCPPPTSHPPATARQTQTLTLPANGMK